MAKHIGAMAAGIAIGLVLTGVLLNQEERDTSGTDKGLPEKETVSLQRSARIRFAPLKCAMEASVDIQRPGSLRTMTKQWSGR